MAKRALQIFVVLGIALKSKPKKMMLQVFVLAIGLVLLSFGATFLWELYHNNAIVIVWVLVCVAIAYGVISFLHTFIFQTNAFLEALLKDTLHELNIPLSVIKANTQMLKTQMQQEPKALKRLERIEHASEDLYALYKQIDYHIKREINVEVREKFYIDEMVAELIQDYEEIYPHSMIQISLAHTMIYADKYGFKRVVSNLLSNALKYNHLQKPIHIKQEDNRLIIQDEGIGMSEEEIFLIFNRYYQANSHQEGYGIGLSVVKAYCDKFKIGFSIHSQKNQGTQAILDISNLVI